MTTSTTLPTTGTWAIDPTHTVIGFTARHLVAAKVRGNFKAFSGDIEISGSPETSSVSVSIDAASIDTGVADRDGHMRSADFLDVDNHPTLEFRSSSVRPVEGGYEVAGDLTIRGTALPVSLEMEYLGVVTDPWGNEKALFSAQTEINREDWGLVWNAPLETGGMLVGKKVKIELEVQAAQAA
jgi:polyisoprenoid-binding protein YceI